MRILQRSFWAAALPRGERSAAQGFLTGAGLGAWHGDFAVLSVDGVLSGLAGAGSMFALSVVFALAAAPPEEAG